MKKCILFFLTVFWLLPSIASAHTQLSTSNPAEGQVITVDLHEISLTFNESIEELSTMKLFLDGNEVPFQQVQIQAEKMIGTLSKPMENGTYLIEWKIAGKDGHPVTGEISFLVQREIVNQDPNSPTSNQDPNNSGEVQQDDTINPSDSKEDEKNTTEKAAEKQSQPLTLAVIIGFVAVLGIGIFLSLRKK